MAAPHTKTRPATHVRRRSTMPRRVTVSRSSFAYSFTIATALSDWLSSCTTWLDRSEAKTGHPCETSIHHAAPRDRVTLLLRLLFHHRDRAIGLVVEMHDLARRRGHKVLPLRQFFQPLGAEEIGRAEEHTSELQ